MDKIEHLLTCLAEECGEVAKECHKALRFGLNDQLTMDPTGPRGTEGPTNAEKIIGELNDIMAVVGMLVQRGIFPAHWPDYLKQEQKRQKVELYMGYATRVGALNVATTGPDDLPVDDKTKMLSDAAGLISQMSSLYGNPYDPDWQRIHDWAGEWNAEYAKLNPGGAQ